MLKSNVAWSTDKDSYNAGKASAKKAVCDLVQTKVAFLYTSVDNDVKKVLEGAKDELGTAPIIGCTSSSGIIVPDGFISSPNGFVGILALGDPDAQVGVAASERGKDPRETGKKVAIEAMKKAGVNRISVNPQTMNQKTLDIIGRRHSVEDIKKAFYMAKEEGFNNINMDIILGLPQEKAEDVENTMREIQKLAPESLTVHTLAVKRASRLKENILSYDLTAAEEMESMINISSYYAGKMGLAPYYMYRQKAMLGNFENVGYCKKGMESIYNVEIMEEKQTIIATGAGGATKLYNPDKNQLVRVFNVKSVDDYLSRFDEMIERKEIALSSNKW